MATLTEDYVSFETAKLLREKGFDEECDYEYGVPVVEQGYVLQRFFKPIKNSELIDDAYVAPTLQLAMKWLREIYSLEIYPYHDFPRKWWFEIIKYPYPVSEYESESIYNSYEDACASAIKYCLENLI